MNENFQKIKSENKQKDEKINLLEEQIKKTNDLFNKKIADLTIEMDKLKNMVYIPLVKIDFSYRSNYKCCENECINTNNPIGNCIVGNGFVNLINDENIIYIQYGEGIAINYDSQIFAENSFKKPENCINHSLFYFEIKCRIEGKFRENEMYIGLKIGDDHKYVRFGANIAKIIDENNEGFYPPLFDWNNNDVFGCGLVYPPEDFPYIFFTQNGKQIGKAVLIKDKSASFKPYVVLNCCSIETNFGKDLETKPFIYDFSKHLAPKFY
uniref:Uncharacterized protein n=1 Tax=Meloidogyne enterolobii TaxID=390850 RepID=A0A6V7WT19_MELEN|nr:unnamed protein product [Meloidogyne enterolobii]